MGWSRCKWLLCRSAEPKIHVLMITAQMEHTGMVTLAMIVLTVETSDDSACGSDTGNDCCGACGSTTYDCGGDDNAGGGDDDGGDDGSAECVDTDNGATDSYGDGCDGCSVPKLVQWVR